MVSLFCFWNLTFMVTLTSLFLYKLKQVFTNYIQLNERAKSEYVLDEDEFEAVDIEDEQQKENEKMVKTFTKTTLLALSSLFFTSISCTLLIARFRFHVQSQFVYTLAEWIVAIDIYSNFLFITLSYTYFDPFYYKICKICDNQCQLLWYKLLFGGEKVEDKIDNPDIVPQGNQSRDWSYQ